MARPFITIIGLGSTGSSLALALRKEPGDFDLVGHEKSSVAEGEARRLNVVTRTEWNLHRSVEGSSLVVLAIPLPEIEETLRQIAEDLAPESLLLVLNSLMHPVVQMAERTIPGHRRLVVGHAIEDLRPASAPNSERYTGNTFCLATTAQTEPAAIELASDFVERVGAKPHFLDAAEHDGIMALVDQAPQVLGAALLALSLGSNGWRESRQLAGGRFANSTAIGDNAGQIFRALRENRANLALRLAQLQDELARWQSLLDADDPLDEEDHPLLAALESITEGRAQWEAEALSHSFEAGPGESGNDAGAGMFRQLFLGGLGRRKQSPSGR